MGKKVLECAPEGQPQKYQCFTCKVSVPTLLVVETLWVSSRGGEVMPMADSQGSNVDSWGAS